MVLKSCWFLENRDLCNFINENKISRDRIQAIVGGKNYTLFYWG